MAVIGNVFIVEKIRGPDSLFWYGTLFNDTCTVCNHLIPPIWTLNALNIFISLLTTPGTWNMHSWEDQLLISIWKNLASVHTNFQKTQPLLFVTWPSVLGNLKLVGEQRKKFLQNAMYHRRRKVNVLEAVLILRAESFWNRSSNYWIVSSVLSGVPLLTIITCQQKQPPPMYSIWALWKKFINCLTSSSLCQCYRQGFMIFVQNMRSFLNCELDSPDYTWWAGTLLWRLENKSQIRCNEP